MNYLYGSLCVLIPSMYMYIAGFIYGNSLKHAHFNCDEDRMISAKAWPIYGIWLVLKKIPGIVMYPWNKGFKHGSKEKASNKP